MINNIMETIEVDLDKIQITGGIDVNSNEEGLFLFTLPDSKKTVQFRLLNDREDDEVENDAKKEASIMGLKVAPKITRKLERIIFSINGDSDPLKKRAFLEGGEFSNRDSMELRKYYNSILPSVNTIVEAIGKTSNTKIMYNVQPTVAFFFPALGI
jgi:hypothetical protein